MNIDKKNTNRLESLDALRGLSILLMVLSSSIAFGGILPAWMFHAQVPPPKHIFNPALPGITWVDIVFPVFLFSMGVAIPLSINKKLQQQTLWRVIFDVFKRFLLLAFFAIFTLHARAAVMSKEPALLNYLLSIACFALLFLIYTNWASFINKRSATILKTIGLFIAILFLLRYPFSYGKLDITRSDVIILVLANMAFFASIIWVFTKGRPFIRLAILPFIMAIFLASKQKGSWNEAVFNWSPAIFLFKFNYLKYLFIVIPGTIVGDWFLKNKIHLKLNNKFSLSVAVLSLGIIFTNLIGLFSRQLLPNLFITIAACALIVAMVKRANFSSGIYKKLIAAAIYALLLGLFFEAFEGGIKKDNATFSYYMVATGLAIFLLITLLVLENEKPFAGIIKYLALNGKNPMIAYTAGNLLLIPVLKISGLDKNLYALKGNAFQGLMQGIIFTTIVSLVTVFFTRKKIFWKT